MCISVYCIFISLVLTFFCEDARKEGEGGEQSHDNPLAALLGPEKAEPLKSCENTTVGGIWHLGSCKNMEQVFSLQLRPLPNLCMALWLFIYGCIISSTELDRNAWPSQNCQRSLSMRECWKEWLPTRIPSYRNRSASGREGGREVRG